MISGIGIDIVEVKRIEASICRNDGFKILVFSSAEINYCENEGSHFMSYAGKFAAKEAFLKALGSGWANHTAFNEIEIVNNDLGKPYIRLIGQTSIECKLDDFSNVQLSISHSESYATAMVIIEKMEE